MLWREKIIELYSNENAVSLWANSILNFLQFSNWSELVKTIVYCTSAFPSLEDFYLNSWKRTKDERKWKVKKKKKISQQFSVNVSCISSCNEILCLRKESFEIVPRDGATIFRENEINRSLVARRRPTWCSVAGAKRTRNTLEPLGNFWGKVAARLVPAIRQTRYPFSKETSRTKVMERR